MKLPVDGVQAFVLVAELGSFGRAADRLALSQTALALCAANVGVAVLPTAKGTALASHLIEVPLVDPIVFRSVELVRRRGETLSPAAAALYNLLQVELSKSGQHR